MLCIYSNKYHMKKATEKAIGICQKVGKTSGSSKKLLNTIFPRTTVKITTKKGSLILLLYVEQKIARPRKRLQSASMVNLVPFPLFHLMKHLQLSPRERLENTLRKFDRIKKKTQIKRLMNPASIRQANCDTFHDFPCAANARFMCCGQNDNLSYVLNGDKVGGLAGTGSLYVCEVCICSLQ